MMGHDNKMLRRFYETARSNQNAWYSPNRNHINMLKAASEAALAEGICFPVLLGNEEKIGNIAAENHIDLTGIEIINLRHDREEDRRVRFAKRLPIKEAAKE